MEGKTLISGFSLLHYAQLFSLYTLTCVLVSLVQSSLFPFNFFLRKHNGNSHDLFFWKVHLMFAVLPALKKQLHLIEKKKIIIEYGCMHFIKYEGFDLLRSVAFHKDNYAAMWWSIHLPYDQFFIRINVIDLE